MSQSKHATTVNKNNIINDLHRVTGELGRPPNTHEYRDNGQHSVQTARKYLNADKWIDVLRNANLDPCEANLCRHPDELIKQDLRRVTKKLGHAPRMEDYREHGEISLSSVMDRGELPDGTRSWAEALRFADIDPSTRPNDKRIPTEELVTDIHLGALMLGHTPSSVEIERWGEYSSSTYRTRWGDYAAAVEAAQLPPTGTELSDELVEDLIEFYNLDIDAGDVPIVDDEEMKMSGVEM